MPEERHGVAGALRTLGVWGPFRGSQGEKMRPIAGWGTLLVMVLSLFLSACATTSDAPATPSLYKRLGGREGIAGVVDGFVTNALADPRIGPAFKALPAAKVGPLKTNIADFICDQTGGPCSYVGRPMKEAHKGMRLA